MRKNTKIAVLGGGLWGTALAHHIAQLASTRPPRPKRDAFSSDFKGKARPGVGVWLWEFLPKAAKRFEATRRHPHMPGFRLHRDVEVTSRLAKAVEAVDVLFFVLPSHFLRRTAKNVARLGLPERTLVVNASKGIEPHSLKTMGEVLAESLPGTGKRIYTFSGPSFAREVARGTPTRMVLAGRGGSRAKRLRHLLEGGPISVVMSSDRKGVELGGSLKNVLAIGCGILDGLRNRGRARVADNTKAAYVTEAVLEMGRLIKACGGRAQTVNGLAGLGDLFATGTSQESRNRAFGEKLGEGKNPRRAVAEIPTVVEGIETSMSAYELAAKVGGRYPILDAVWKVVHRGRGPETIVRALEF